MIDPLSTTAKTSVDASTPTVSAQAEERQKIVTLAQQFESMLISQMLREMKESMAPEQEEGGFGADILGDSVNNEFSMALSKSGGLGLAGQLMQSLQRLDPKSQDVPVEGDAPATTLPSVTSGFGLRLDPLNGQQRMHNGTDLRVAYGQEVRAAAGGVVTFAGEQPGYGLVVKIDHGDGLETRYAHLSSAGVTPGMTVEAGTPIARSGNSGRTTGAHLHFEVRQDGKPVNPENVSGFVSVANAAH